VTLSSATASPVIITVAKGGSFDIYEGGLVLNGIVLTGDDQTRDAPLVTVHDGGVLNLGHNAGIRNFALASETDIITASGSRASVIFNGGSVADNTLGVNSYPVRLTSGAIASVNLGGIHSNLCGETEVALYTDTKNTYMPSPDALVSGEVKIDAATPYEEFLAAIGRGDPTIILTDNFTVTEDIVIASNTVITSADASAPAVLSFAPDATVTVNSGLTLVGVKLYDGTGTVRTAPIFSVVDGGSLTLGENAYICDFTTAENVHLIELLHLTEGTAPYVMLSGSFIMDNILGEGAYPVSLMGGSVLNANTGSITNNFSAGVEVAILRDEASIYNAGEAIVNGAVTAPVAEESEETPSEGDGQTSSEQEGAEVPADENTQTGEELPAEENSQSRDEPDGTEADTPSADADTGNDAQAQ